jgi:hypothetical protein
MDKMAGRLLCPQAVYRVLSLAITTLTEELLAVLI